MDGFQRELPVLERNCNACCKPLTFKADKKSKYKYHKKCWKQLIKVDSNIRCVCGMGIVYKCHYYKECGRYTGKCRFCLTDWIEGYCDWHR